MIRGQLNSGKGAPVKIAVIGKGNVGGGLADWWEKAGHDVQRLGRDGGEVGDAEAILIACPGPAVPGVFETVSGLDGKTVIDATNLVGAQPPDGFASNAEFIKSKTQGPTAKSFNLNFAALYDQIAGATQTPGNVWCGDEEARALVEELIRAAGYDPIYAGGLDKAAVSESALQFLFAIAQGGMGPFFYRMAPPGQF
jgi:8-hydroxy-5-deazaflavin:NADPH oxidoreductase